MRITNNHNYFPQFTDSYREITSPNGSIMYRTATYAFREDLPWNEFSNLLAEKYKNTNKVHIIDHACSDGSEAYSLVMKLTTDFDKDTEKFFPIIAKDLDEENIKEAKSDNFDIGFYSIGRINKHTKSNFEKYLSIDDKLDINKPIIAKKKAILQNNVRFEQGNLIDDIENLPNENTVLFARNVWAYLDEEEQEYAIKTLSKKFDNSCLLVVGEYDFSDSNVKQLLNKYGFEPTKVKYVYQKRHDISLDSTVHSAKLAIKNI